MLYCIFLNILYVTTCFNYSDLYLLLFVNYVSKYFMTSLLLDYFNFYRHCISIIAHTKMKEESI
jgi:hypothetical protein